MWTLPVNLWSGIHATLLLMVGWGSGLRLWSALVGEGDAPGATMEDYIGCPVLVTLECCFIPCLWIVVFRSAHWELCNQILNISLESTSELDDHCKPFLVSCLIYKVSEFIIMPLSLGCLCLLLPLSYLTWVSSCCDLLQSFCTGTEQFYSSLPFPCKCPP